MADEICIWNLERLSELKCPRHNILCILSQFSILLWLFRLSCSNISSIFFFRCGGGILIFSCQYLFILSFVSHKFSFSPPSPRWILNAFLDHLLDVSLLILSCLFVVSLWNRFQLSFCLCLAFILIRSLAVIWLPLLFLLSSNWRYIYWMRGICKWSEYANTTTRTKSLLFFCLCAFII